MSGTLLGRVTVAGLLVALAVVGCGPVEPGGAGPGPSGGVTMTPSPGTLSPETSSPETSSPETSSPGLASPETPNPEASGSVTSGPDSDTAGPSSGDAHVAWVPPGPGNEFPRYDDGQKTAARWHKAFSDHDCDAIAALGPERDQRQLYAGLGDACRAVLKKNDRLWSSAEVALRHVGDPTDCLDRSALRLLRDLVMAHQRAPHADIDIVDSPRGAACDSDGPASPSTSVSPSPTSVSPSGTSQIRPTPHSRPRPSALTG